MAIATAVRQLDPYEQEYMRRQMYEMEKQRQFIKMEQERYLPLGLGNISFQKSGNPVEEAQNPVLLLIGN